MIAAVRATHDVRRFFGLVSMILRLKSASSAIALASRSSAAPTAPPRCVGNT
jgi:hypothetical protein